jgi:vacuolar-type H+-ATPase subunit I/STV1
MASKVKSAAGSLERLFLPRLNSIDGELKAINTRIDAVHGRIDGVEKSISESDKRTESFRSEFRAELKVMNSKLDHIDQKLDIDRRMSIIEAKMKEFEKRS